ncbi:sialic acid binding Ig-like lectin 15, like isoform X2 [Festucalex cinctus]
MCVYAVPHAFVAYCVFNMRVCVRVCVLLLLITGSVPSSSMTVRVSEEVTVFRGQDAILGCFIIYSKYDRYASIIKVSWIGRKATSVPFFQCGVKNDSLVTSADCLGPNRFSLAGDLCQGVASLLIRDVTVIDEGVLFCEVALDGGRPQRKELTLKVQVKPAILSLSLVTGSPSIPQRLQCIAEGQPCPNITWLSASGGPLATASHVQTLSAGLYVNSSIPYEQQDELTCRVESALGRTEQTYRPANMARVAALACGGIAAAVLLLATGGVIVHRLRRRARNRDAQIQQNSQTHNRLPPSSHGPDGGAVEIQAVYTTVAFTESREGMSSTHRHQDNLYSTVAFH